MSYSLEQFAADTQQILKQNPGPAGREKVCAKLAALLEDDDFIAAYCGPDARPGARVIHHDPETGFSVRVTGTDLSKLERLRFDPENGTVVSEKRPIFGSAA